MDNNVKDIMKKASARGQTLVEYLMDNYSQEELGSLSVQLHGELDRKNPVIEDFRRSYERVSPDIKWDFSGLSQHDFDMLEAEIQTIIKNLRAKLNDQMARLPK